MGKGFRRKRPNITINFGEDHDLHGLELTVKPASLNTYFEMVESAELEGETTSAQMGRFAHTCDVLAGQILAWNYEDEAGNAVPPTVETLRNEDFKFVFSLVAAWIQAMQGVPDPLESGSGSGDPSPEQSAMTELESLSQLNSTEPSSS